MPRSEIALEDFTSFEGQLEGHSAAEIFLYGMTQGKSIDDVIAMSPREKKRLGMEFSELNRLQEETGFYYFDREIYEETVRFNKTERMEAVDINAALAEKNGQMFRKAAEELLNEYDAENKKGSLQASGNRIETIREVGYVLQTAMNRYKENDNLDLLRGYADGFGGRREAAEIEEKLAENIFQIPKTEAEKQETFELNAAFYKKQADYKKMVLSGAKEMRTVGERNLQDFFPSGPLEDEMDLDALLDSETRREQSIQGIEGFFKRGADGKEEPAVDKSEGLITLAVLLAMNKNPQLTFTEIMEGYGKGNLFVEMETPTLSPEKAEDFRDQIKDKSTRKNPNPDVTEIPGKDESDSEIDRLLDELEESYSELPPESRVEVSSEKNGKTDVLSHRFHNGDEYKKFSSIVAEESSRILEAFDSVKENPAKLGGVIADAAKAYAEINPHKEYGKLIELYGDGEKINRTEGKMKAVAAMSALSRFCTNADTVINSAVKGRDSQLPFTADTGEKDSDAARRIYESARAQMTPDEQKKFMNASFNQYQQKMVLGTFVSYEKQILGEEALDSSVFAAADKAISVISKTDAPLHSFPVKAALEIENVQKAAKAFAVLPEQSSRDELLSEGIRNNDMAQIDKDASSMNTGLQKPDSLSMWVRFWGNFGYYKDTIGRYNAAMADYKAHAEIETAKQEAGKLIDARAEKAKEQEKEKAARKVRKEAGKEAAPTREKVSFESLNDASKTAKSRNPAVKQQKSFSKKPVDKQR
ncbi:MAG: hypothetical protein LUE86_05220 [Clostridiales bacterium]|nr:hypothetical protein [Clostridiales bacterium]